MNAGTLKSGYIILRSWGRWLAAFLLACLLLVTSLSPAPSSRALPAPVWGSRPVLAYLTLTPSIVGQLQQSGVLSNGQLQVVQDVARSEMERLRLLEASSLKIIERQDLSLAEKRLALVGLGYNQQVRQIVSVGQQTLLQQLGRLPYQRFVGWVEARWQVERTLHGLVPNQAGARTFRIFATHYNSSGAYIVALPDGCLKLANKGSQSCDGKGYTAGQGYAVFMSYKKSAGVMVGEAGPWNVDDNYWASVYDPQPRRMFADLAVGMPEAQAAYFNGYNGGQDQYGRTVTAPFGIDLGDGVGNDIGLPPGVNDWIDISYLWTEAWGTASSGGAVVNKVTTATPQADGSLVHEVLEGQALWSIAAGYEIEMAELLRINGLNEQSVIRPGDRLVILLAPSTASPTEQRATATRMPKAPTPPAATPGLGNTPAVRLASPPGQVTSLPEEEPVSEPLDPVWIAILAALVVGAGLVLASTLSRRNGAG